MTNEELVKEIKKGINKKTNLEQLYLNNEPFIKKKASKYIAYADFDDLVQQGYIGMYEAIEPFDESKGYKFLTYASYHIKQSMTRYIDNNGRTIRIPIHLISQMQQHKKINNFFKAEHGREPTDDELCRALKINFKQLEDLKANIIKYQRIGSLDEQVKGVESDNMTIGDLVSDDIDIENDVTDKVYEEYAKEELWQIVERECNETETKIINNRFKDNMTYKNIGAVLGVPEGKARRGEEKALRKLRFPRVSRELQAKFEINLASAYSGGVRSFDRTWTSSTERVALKNIELEETLV